MDFSLVCKKDSLRIILEFVAYFYLDLQLIDVKTTFLSDNIKEEVYMKQYLKVFLLVMVNIWFASLRNPFMD